MKQNHGFQEPFGQHLILDGFGCCREALADSAGIADFLNRMPAEIGMTRIMEPYVIKSPPPRGQAHENGGLIGFIIIAESHISIHTFPELRFLYLDIFSCKRLPVRKATQMAIAHFKIARMEVNLFDRGLEFRGGDGCPKYSKA